MITAIMGFRPLIKIKYLSLFLFLFFYCNGFSETNQITKIRGTIVDADTKEPLPFVNILFKGTTIGTVSDDKGNFFIETRNASDSIIFSYLGYKAVTKKVNKSSFQVFNIELEPNRQELETVVVTPGENPANRLIKKIIRNKERNYYKNYKSYKCEMYNKLQIDLNNIDSAFRKKRIFKQLQFVFDNVDTNAVTGKVYLPILISETVSDFYYQKSPKEEKEIIKASQVSGVKNESVTQLTGSMTQSLNIYDNFMVFRDPGFVSPITDFALIYYRYYITDSAVVDNHWSYHVTFKPIRKQERTFTGDFWVADTVFAVTKMQMRLNKEANLNFINELVASYEYKSYKDSFYYLVNEETLVDFNITETDKIKGFFGHKSTSYRNYVFGKTMEESVKELDGNVIIADSALDKNKSYWDTIRPSKLTPKEQNVYSMVDSIKNVPIYRTFIDVVNLLINYHYPIGNYEIGPYYTFYSYNEIEGHRFRIGGQTSNDFSKKIKLNAHLAYGTKDRRLKYGFGVKYMFDRSPRRTVGFLYKDDIEQLGQSINAFKTDNFLLSILRRNPNYKLTMVKSLNTFYEHEWHQGLSNTINFNHQRIFGTQYIPLDFEYPGDTTHLKRIVTTEIVLQTHFAYKEKFVVGDFKRLSLGTRYPVFDLYCTWGFKNVLNSQYNYFKVNLTITQKINTSPFGYFRYVADAGRIFNQLPYPLLELHKGNETYALDISSFNMMNYYEFVSDKYASLYAEQHFQGFILNQIPLLRKLKWREVATFKGLIGSLDDKNKNFMKFPQGLGEVNKPYVEVGLGLENILKVFRIDAMWRLSYLDHPDIEMFGLRAKLQIIL